MTTGVVLGTHETKNKALYLVSLVGFHPNGHPQLLVHTSVDKLGLQIHPPHYFKGVEGIVTEMEFDDMTNRFPNNEDYLKVLKDLYQNLPDLVFRDLYLAGIQKQTPINPVSALLETRSH
jgi:hypothetical protein